eukprot:15744758-Heterocapsa_arctica.AAC.1
MLISNDQLHDLDATIHMDARSRDRPAGLGACRAVHCATGHRDQHHPAEAHDGHHGHGLQIFVRHHDH